MRSLHLNQLEGSYLVYLHKRRGKQGTEVNLKYVTSTSIRRMLDIVADAYVSSEVDKQGQEVRHFSLDFDGFTDRTKDGSEILFQRYVGQTIGGGEGGGGRRKIISS
mmetsp:Transcript_21463/g.35350  ORF Transcript_21463/g.35350 Transcript_21463/m.35350 type:complete len:107 (-) Transcript_21463:651-971(-)